MQRSPMIHILAHSTTKSLRNWSRSGKRSRGHPFGDEHRWHVTARTPEADNTTSWSLSHTKTLCYHSHYTIATNVSHREHDMKQARQLIECVKTRGPPLLSTWSLENNNTCTHNVGHIHSCMCLVLNWHKMITHGTDNRCNRIPCTIVQRYKFE